MRSLATGTITMMKLLLGVTGRSLCSFDLLGFEKTSEDGNLSKERVS